MILVEGVQASNGIHAKTTVFRGRFQRFYPLVNGKSVVYVAEISFVKQDKGMDDLTRESQTTRQVPIDAMKKNGLG